MVVISKNVVARSGSDEAIHSPAMAGLLRLWLAMTEAGSDPVRRVWNSEALSKRVHIGAYIYPYQVCQYNRSPVFFLLLTGRTSGFLKSPLSMIEALSPKACVAIPPSDFAHGEGARGDFAARLARSSRGVGRWDPRRALGASPRSSGHRA